MQLLKSLIILIVGFVLLIKGADFFVEGSSAVAKRLRIPSMIIGMTIVAMGTSLPECAVSVTASLTGNNSLAISNAVGSNIFNLLVVCGVCTLFVPLAVQKSTLQKEFPLSIFCAGLLLLLGYLGMTLGRINGILFLIIFTGCVSVAKYLSDFRVIYYRLNVCRYNILNTAVARPHNIAAVYRIPQCNMVLM